MQLLGFVLLIGCGGKDTGVAPDASMPDCAACTEGATMCDGNAIVRCTDLEGDGCLAWSTSSECSNGQSCSLGRCAETCVDECVDGAVMCAGTGALRTCGEADGDPCRDWLAETSCTAGEVCSNGSCNATCQDECQPGDSMCSGTGRLECVNTNGDDCHEWGPVIPCGGATSCSAGVCAPTCSDECSTATCSGTQLRSCGQYDLDACLDLGTGTSCAFGCSSGACNTEVGVQASVVSGGESTFFCAIKTDASIACWGMINWGTLTPPAGAFVSLDAGYDHICAIRANGTLDCWGDGGWTEPTGTFKQVSSGYNDSCAVRDDGTLACWPTNSLIAPPGNYINVAVGDHHACAIKTDNTVVCWGWNGHGQANAPSGTFTVLSAGYDSTCGIKTDGTLHCWGANATNQSTAPSGTYKAVSTGWWHYCAIRTDNTLACWGKNTSAQTIPPAGEFLAVGANPSSSCGIRADRSLTCWGQPSTPPSGPFGR